MNILFNFINNTKSIAGVDYRAKMFNKLLYAIKSEGHNIFIDPRKNLNHPCIRPYRNLIRDFHIFEEKQTPHIDLWIVPYAHAKKIRGRYKYFRKHGKTIIMYEHGWLNKSIFLDKGELFSDSYLTDSVNKRIEKGYDEKGCEQYRTALLQSNISKRPQKQKDSIPPHIMGKYVFIPVQKIDDVSVNKYSKISMLNFLREAVSVARQHELDIVIKQHPHATTDHKAVKERVKRIRRHHKGIHFIEAPIFTLMKYAKITACINSGSMVDNFITQTPVYCCGKSFFYKSGTVIYDPDIKQGLNKAIIGDYDWDEMKIKQLKMLWWLKHHLLFSDLPAKKNLKRFERLLCI